MRLAIALVSAIAVTLTACQTHVCPVAARMQVDSAMAVALAGQALHLGRKDPLPAFRVARFYRDTVPDFGGIDLTLVQLDDSTHSGTVSILPSCFTRDGKDRTVMLVEFSP
jgi:hypothetical protein